MTDKTSVPRSSAAEYVPQSRRLPALRQAAEGCRGCELHAAATQVVFGEGPQRARLVLVGEQPGDEEDRSGRPFVGPSGRLLDELLAEAGLLREEVYLTNAVKHFRFTLRSGRRLHVKPSAAQVHACRPWLEAELLALRPGVLVLMGATAAQALLGADFRVTQRRGQVFASPFAAHTFATVHPSSVLRSPDPGSRRLAREAMLADLTRAAECYREHACSTSAVPGIDA